MPSNLRLTTFRTVDRWEIRDIDFPGVYAFHLYAIRPNLIGLQSRGNHSVEKLEAARTKCLQILNEVTKFTVSQKQLKVEVTEVGYSKLPYEINLAGSIEPTSTLYETIESLKLDDLEQFLQIIYTIPTALPPIYVGMTTKSLHLRYTQHERDFKSASDFTTFGGRFSKNQFGFDWSDLLFSYIPCDHQNLSEDTIKALEKYIHFFSRPILGHS